MSPGVPERPAPDRLRHKTVAAAVADSLRQQILNGDLPAGAQLRQDALAEAFGISRIPVREALLQLEATNLVKIMPHRGAVVIGLWLQEVEDIFQLRAQPEPELLLLSAPHPTPDDIRSLDAVSKDYGAALESGQVLGGAT
jgi:DNA-binding GntR family transcriptional regulator